MTGRQLCGKISWFVIAMMAQRTSQTDYLVLAEHSGPPTSSDVMQPSRASILSTSITLRPLNLSGIAQKKKPQIMI